MVDLSLRDVDQPYRAWTDGGPIVVVYLIPQPVHGEARSTIGPQ